LYNEEIASKISRIFHNVQNLIKTLEQRKQNVQESEINEINLKIQRYESEKIKIKKMFPDNFFEMTD